ncbi:TonB-dependent receptor [Alteromonas pelagimontana]|uniref:TonB-dependent receptor n=1 Tax=Alteromonas pelagimontana TaxID=1858656 RepID=A0A6M4MBF9_9ALTE|nr:TonB-dependent receptor [Alteromonas pelagimontana]QJR80367.1 TonB-dependent receptor [Alteromonas pelagimontana]
MFKYSLITLTIFSLFSGAAAAATISGKVTDDDGNPIAGAEVKIEGSRRVALTDENGMYRFNDINQADVHMHVASNRYLHGDKELGSVTGDKTVNFNLTRSSVENITVTATAMQSSVLESVTPVSVITAEELRKNQAPTLGETLSSTPGVHSTYFGPVSSSPIIRGNAGPRVKIVQNGLDVSDVSRVGPDHNVAASSSSATQIEVLRGPATLQYGSGAIGGVVNVVDKRIPQTMPLAMEGEAEVRYSTADNGKFGKVDITHGVGDFAYHFDGYKRKTENVDIPGYASIAPDGDEPYGVLQNSAMDTTDFTAGLSYIQDEGYIGFAVEKLDNLYGVPGHSHEHHHDEEEEELTAEAEAGTRLDVDMTRYQTMGEWHSPVKGITNVKFAAAYTDYSHAELEEGEIGTVFNNEGTNVRISADHADINGWHGVVGIEATNSDYEAIGEEAFTPATETTSYALYLIEQKKIDNITLELGGRVERTEFDVQDIALEFEVDEQDHEHEEELHTYSFAGYDFTSTSMSAGINWEYLRGQSMAVTLSRSERAPSQQELFSGGQHLATQTYELGLVYDLDADGHIEEGLKSVEKEVSTNLDLTFRKFTGDWGYTVSFFYNQADDYIYQNATGLTALGAEHEEGEHAEEEGLPVFYFQQADADIYGMEAEAYVDFSSSWRLEVYGDMIRAKLNNEDLPRIPPMRIGTTLSYVGQQLSGEVGVQWNDEQDEIAPYETFTDSYTLLNANIQYETPTNGLNWILFANADNLTDEEARLHTSFLKDKAPLPGRNFTIGVRTVF